MSDPLTIKNDDSFLEDSFGTSLTISPPHQISKNLLKVRAKTVHSSDSLKPPVTPNIRNLIKRSSSIPARHQVFSNWADAYEDFDSSNFRCYSSNVVETTFSENDSMSLHENSTSTPTVVLTRSMAFPVEPGMVLAMCLSKDGHRFEQLNLNMSLENVVSTFLITDNKPKLPVSFTESKKSRPKIMERNQMVKTIAENIDLDVKTQGLIFSTGLVNSRLCYKVCLGDLGQMQKILAVDAKRERVSCQL